MHKDTGARHRFEGVAGGVERRRRRGYVDGAFDEERFEDFKFTSSPVLYGTHTFGARTVNNFGNVSATATDTLTISPDCDGDSVLNESDVDTDCDHFWNSYETVRSSDPLEPLSTPEICNLGDDDKDGLVDEQPAGAGWDIDNDGTKG